VRVCMCCTCTWTSLWLLIITCSMSHYVDREVFAHVCAMSCCRGLYGGMGMHLVRSVPNSAIMFLAYELVSGWVEQQQAAGRSGAALYQRGGRSDLYVDGVGIQWPQIPEFR
jgi:hypothetical protein